MGNDIQRPRGKPSLGGPADPTVRVIVKMPQSMCDELGKDRSAKMRGAIALWIGRERARGRDPGRSLRAKDGDS